MPKNMRIININKNTIIGITINRRLVPV